MGRVLPTRYLRRFVANQILPNASPLPDLHPDDLGYGRYLSIISKELTMPMEALHARLACHLVPGNLRVGNSVYEPFIPVCSARSVPEPTQDGDQDHSKLSCPGAV